MKISFTKTYSNNQLHGTEADFADEQISSFALYICHAGVVRKIYDNLPTTLESMNLLPKDVTSTGKIYAVANGELCPGLSAIQEGSNEQLLLGLKTAYIDQSGHITKSVMTGSSTAISNRVKIDLKRDLARFDLKIKPDAGIEIHSISVSGLAAESSLFETTPEEIPSSTSVTMNQTFTQTLTTSTERLFYTHPLPSTSTPAVATIEASYHGTKVGMKVPLREIRRNQIYTLNVNSSNGTLTATVSVSDMSMGDETTSDKENATIRIDKTRSVLSDGVVISRTDDRLTFSSKGGEITLFLTGDFDKELKEVSDHEINGFELTPNKEGERSLSYRIKVGMQTKQGSDYPAVVLSFGRIGETNPAKWDRIVVVATTYAPYSVVTIGDLDWMMTNGYSRDLHEYPLIKEGTTLRDLFSFNRDWMKYSGKLHQWGPRTGTFARAAWERTPNYTYENLSNCNGPIIGTPAPTSWTSDNLPCPEGWRLPTYEEYQTIWPKHGTVIPQDGTPTKYTTSTGATYTATIEEFGAIGLTNFTSFANAKNLMITDGTHELLFPITGCRNANGVYYIDGRNKWYEGYGYGVSTEAYYWCRDKISNNYIAVGIKDGVVSNDTSNKAPNDWRNVRCVRDVK